MTYEPIQSDDEDWRVSVPWYHTVDLGHGVVTNGTYDHRPVVGKYGLPESLVGMTALDIGTWDGFWAFELERRGAAVTAIDVPSYADFDWLPWIRDSLGERATATGNFEFARERLDSRVNRVTCNVYDLSPERLGVFDVVFCGGLLLHLQNPIRALLNIASVTRELAVIETTVDLQLDALHPERPLIHFGHRDALEDPLGSSGIYWRFSTHGLVEMLEYCGFESVEPQGVFSLPPVDLPVTVVHGRTSRLMR